MIEVIRENWILLVLALIIGFAVAWWIFAANRKTSVERDDTPAEGEVQAKRNQALIDSAPAAATPLSQPEPEAVAKTATTAAPVAKVAPVAKAAAEPAPIPAPAPAPTPASTKAPAPSTGGDDLTRIKGLGPKLKALLNSMGITTFAQIAAWTEADIDGVDAKLGNFKGRIRRDNWVEQAKFLSAGDTAGYEGKFGKL